MTIVYIDILFLINSITTYILLDITSFLSGAFLRRKDHIFSSILSGIMAVIVFFMPSGQFIGIVVRIFICITIVSAAFRPNLHHLVRLSGIFLISSLFMGGIVMLFGAVVMESGIIYFNMSYPVLFAGFLVGYIIFRLVLGRRGMIKMDEIVTIEAVFGLQRLKFTAMVDTGNLLREPVTKLPVILVSPEMCEGIIITGRDYPTPMRSAGQDFALIHTYKPDSLMINGKIRDDFMIGIAGSKIQGVQGTHGIIGGTIWDS